MKIFKLVHGERGFSIWRNIETCQFHVTRTDLTNQQVSSIVPGDMPSNGGVWMAKLSDKGIAFVSRGYSKTYAMEIYRQCVSEAKEMTISCG